MPFDPCGMVMDVARVATLRDCRFFRDDSTVAKIKWYRAPEGALCFPTHHKFSKLNWYTAPWDASGVGEVFGAPETYFSGATPPGVNGQNFFGALEDFQRGATFNPDVDVARTGFGVAVACPGCAGNAIAMESGGCAFVLDEAGERILRETP